MNYCRDCVHFSSYANSNMGCCGDSCIGSDFDGNEWGCDDFEPKEICQNCIHYFVDKYDVVYCNDIRENVKADETACGAYEARKDENT